MPGGGACGSAPQDGASVFDGRDLDDLYRGRWAGQRRCARRVAAIPTGRLWVGTAGGLNRFDSRPWIKLSVPEGGMIGWAPADQFDIQIKPLDSQYFNYLGALLAA